MIICEKLTKSYRTKQGEVRALDDVSLELHPGEFIVVRGPSGCGKSTLLLTLGGMLRPTRGRVTIYGSVEGVPRTVVTELSEAEHSLAVRAYEGRLPITCSGELVREGRSWTLKNPRGVRLLSGEE